MRVLLDMDIARYQIGSIELENEYAAPYLKGTSAARMPAPIAEIEKYTRELIESVIEATGADEYVCVLSGKGNFRFDVAKQQKYKGNRDDFVKPYHYKTVGDFITNNYHTVVVDGIEADDWLGIEQRKDPDNTIIASRDKDLKTVHGWHYRWPCGENQPEVPNHWISEFEARHFFFYQMLVGDNTDNICGCGQRKEVMWGGKLCLRRKGIGAKAAIALLADCNTVQELYDVVSQCYQNEFDSEWEAIMLENARLLFIGQTPDNLFEWNWLDYSLSKEENLEVMSVLSDGETRDRLHQETETLQGMSTSRELQMVSGEQRTEIFSEESRETTTQD